MTDTSRESKWQSFWLVRLVRALYVGIRGYFAFLGLLVTMLVGVWTYALMHGVEQMGSTKVESLPQGDLRLTLDLNGPIAEHNPSMIERFWASLRGQSEIYLPELRSGLRRAGKDPNVKTLVVRLGSVQASPAEYVELRRILADFKGTGKTIDLTIEEPSEWQYYVATVGDFIKINPTSSVTLLGPAFQLVYFAETLKKLGVGIEVLRAGKYKSAFESLIADQPSAETLEQYESMRRSLLDHIVKDVAEGRKKDEETVRSWYRTSIFTAKDALSQGMVDELGYADAPESDDAPEGDQPHRFSLARYSRATEGREGGASGVDFGIGLIEAIGEISMEPSARGMGDDEGITPDGLRRQLAWAKGEKDVKAVVIRVSSPGGSAVASDMIWHEVKSLAAVKPVVVSMGAYAASGGYYISAPASRIVAEPTTITGSIGVIGMLPNLAAFKDKYGVSFHVVNGSDRVALVNPGRSPTEKDRELIGRSIDDTYKTFVTKVAEGRGLEVGKVEALAQGRVYTGLEAQKLGLVDELGGLQAAMTAAKKLGGLDVNQLYPIYQFEEEEFDLRHCLRRPMQCLAMGNRARSVLGGVALAGLLGPRGSIVGGAAADRSLDEVSRRVMGWLQRASHEGPLVLWPGYLSSTLR